MGIKRISSNAVWEDIVGYSRAIVIGNQIEITGTIASENGQIIAPFESDTQTEWILSFFKSLLEKEGFKLEDTIRTRLYVTDISDWEKIGKVHGKFFNKIKPCTTMVEVSNLISKEAMIEIELTAIKQV